MADSIEHFTRAGSFRDSWRGRFHNKWPTMTTMMMKSESEIDYPNITPCPDFGIKSPSLRSWSSSNQDTWTDSRGIDNETTDGDTCSQNAKKNKRCERTCNCVLCVFMVLSVIVAACAGVGLAILLTQPEFGLTGRTQGSQDTLIDINLEETERTILTAKFCNLVKEILGSVNFPTEKGIKSCDAVFRLMKDSEGLHVELHVLPTDGYTLKEKFLRALSELVEERDGNGTIPIGSELNNAEETVNNTNGSNFPKTGGFITFIPEITIENHSNKSDTHRAAIEGGMTHSNLTDSSSSLDTVSADTPDGGLQSPDSGDTLEATDKSDVFGKIKSLENKRKNSKNIVISSGQVNPSTPSPELLTSNGTESVPSYGYSTTVDTIQVDDITTEVFIKNAKNSSTESTSAFANFESDVTVKTTKTVRRGKIDTTENSTTLKPDTDKTNNVSSKLQVSDVSSTSETKLPEDTSLSERTTVRVRPSNVTKHQTNVHSIKRVKLFEVGKPAVTNNISTQNENNVHETKTKKDFVAESLMKGGVFKLPMKTTSKFKFLFTNGASNKD